DASEYSEKHSIARLIGAPPGYVGYGEGGQLTEPIRRRPYTVVLLDEIEKAHADVFNILLQILDDGRLTDGLGRTVDFKNTVFIMTSNVGSEHAAAVNHDPERLRARMTEELYSQFRPEFLNRVDAVGDEFVMTRKETPGDPNGAAAKPRRRSRAAATA